MTLTLSVAAPLSRLVSVAAPRRLAYIPRAGWRSGWDSWRRGRRDVWVVKRVVMPTVALSAVRGVVLHKVLGVLLGDTLHVAHLISELDSVEFVGVFE